jgi:hypothetical protein
MKEKVGTPVYKKEITVVRISSADQAIALYPQQLVLTSPTSGGRSVGIVHSRTTSTECFFPGEHTEQANITSSRLSSIHHHYQSTARGATSVVRQHTTHKQRQVLVLDPQGLHVHHLFSSISSSSSRYRRPPLNARRANNNCLFDGLVCAYMLHVMFPLFTLLL